MDGDYMIKIPFQVFYKYLGEKTDDCTVIKMTFKNQNSVEEVMKIQTIQLIRNFEDCLKEKIDKNIRVTKFRMIEPKAKWMYRSNKKR